MPPKELVDTVLRSKVVMPQLEEGEISSLDEAQLKKIHELVVLEMRYKEKEEFVELLGNEKILSIMRELLPIVHEPIAVLFNKASVGLHFEILFKTLKRVIKVTEKNEPSLPKRIELYEIAMGKFVRDLYAFLHNVAEQDDNTLYETLSWISDLLDFMQRETLDIQPILQGMNKEEQDKVVQEINQLLEYKIYWLGLEENKEKMLKMTEKNMQEKKGSVKDNKKEKAKTKGKKDSRHKREEEVKKEKQVKIAQEKTINPAPTVTNHNSNILPTANIETAPPPRPVLFSIPQMVIRFVQISKHWLTKTTPSPTTFMAKNPPIK